MDEETIVETEGALLNFIRELGELEWRKYQHRSVTKLVDGEWRREDQTDHPPFVSFRFKDEDESTIKKLGAAIASFPGNVRWGLYGHQREGLPGVNWIICPEAVWAARDVALSQGRSTGDYLAEAQPQLAMPAYEDLVGLESALRAEFGKQAGPLPTWSGHYQLNFEGKGMQESKYPREWLDCVPAVVFASLSPGTVRVLLHPGNGMAQGGAPRDIDIEIIAPELRVPNTKLWAKLDEKMNILQVWGREE